MDYRYGTVRSVKHTNITVAIEERLRREFGNSAEVRVFVMPIPALGLFSISPVGQMVRESFSIT